MCGVLGLASDYLVVAVSLARSHHRSHPSGHGLRGAGGDAQRDAGHGQAYRGAQGSACAGGGRGVGRPRGGGNARAGHGAAGPHDGGGDRQLLHLRQGWPRRGTPAQPRQPGPRGGSLCSAGRDGTPRRPRARRHDARGGKRMSEKTRSWCGQRKKAMEGKRRNTPRKDAGCVARKCRMLRSFKLLTSGSMRVLTVVVFFLGRGIGVTLEH